MNDRRHAPLARVGLDKLLAEYPAHDVVVIAHQRYAASKGSWTCVDLIDPDTLVPMQFAIWNQTGNVYRCDEHGAAEDDPFLTVTPLGP